MKLNKTKKKIIKCPECGLPIHIEIDQSGYIDLGITYHWVPRNKGEK